ncbi:hypothetical protein ACYSNR_13735 [Enterococcus sp. LJL128]
MLGFTFTNNTLQQTGFVVVCLLVLSIVLLLSALLGVGGKKGTYSWEKRKGASKPLIVIVLVILIFLIIFVWFNIVQYAVIKF